MWPQANQTYTYDPALLPESPSTPGFEGSVRQEMSGIDGLPVLLTEVFDDLGNPVARSYSFGAREGDVRAMCNAVASDWGMVSFARAHPGQTPRPPVLLSRINPQRMKLDPVILDTFAAARAAEPRTGGDEGLRVSAPTVAAVVFGQSGSVPDVGGTE